MRLDLKVWRSATLVSSNVIMLCNVGTYLYVGCITVLGALPLQWYTGHIQPCNARLCNSTGAAASTADKCCVHWETTHLSAGRHLLHLIELFVMCKLMLTFSIHCYKIT